MAMFTYDPTILGSKRKAFGSFQSDVSSYLL